MKNSVKFFLGGIIAAAIIFGAFAFTVKQQGEENGYMMIRIQEVPKDFRGDSFIQICKEDGTIEVLKTLVASKEFIDENNTKTITLLINKYSKEGYFLKTTSITEVGSKTLTTIILEK